MSTSDLDAYLRHSLSWVQNRLTPIRPIPLYSRSWAKVSSGSGALLRTDESGKEESQGLWVPATFNSLEQPFQHYGGRLLLLGAPGSGKTTILLTLFREALQRRIRDVEAPVPVFIDIKQWSSREGLVEWIASLLIREYPGLDIEHLSLLYLLDGLDELGGPRTAASAQSGVHYVDPRASFIDQVARELPDAQYIVSCRTEEYDQISRELEVDSAVELLPIRQEQIRAYLSDRHLDGWWESMQTSPETLKVMRTPLTLSIMISMASSMLADSNWRLAKPSDMFKRFVAHRFEHEHVKRSEARMPPLAFNLQETEERLGRLAAYMWRGGIYPASFVSRREAVEVLGENADSFLTFARSMDLLDWEAASSLYSATMTDTVSFRHMRFCDYFAVPTLLTYLKRWELGLGEQMHEPEMTQRWIYALAGIRDCRALPYLIETLRSPGARYQTEVAFALGRIGDKDAVSALAESLEHTEWEVRAMAAYALGRIGDTKELPASTSAVHDQDLIALEEAAYVLGRYGDRLAVPAFLEALVATSPRVCETAADILGKIGAPAVAGLEQTLKHINPDVRELAAQALTRITGVDTYRHVIALSSQDPDIRRISVESLGETGGTGTAADIAVALTDDDPDVREAACYALAKVGARGTPSALIKALRDSVPAVREAAAYALGQIRDARAVSALQDMLKDDDWSVRATAAHVLGTLGYKRVVFALLEALTDENTTVRAIAANALGEVGDRGAVNGLRQALNDPEEDVREIAREALEQILKQGIRAVS